MKKTATVIIVCLLSGACYQAPEVTEFQTFKKQIPFLQLPYKRTCYDTVTHLKLNIPDSTFKKYAPAGASGIIGLLADTDLYSAILYSVSGDIQYPVIQTYNRYGTKLNDIGLISGNCCGSTQTCSGYSWGIINKDLSVLIRDSEKDFEIAQSGNLQHTGFRQINKSELYYITDTGYIRLETVKPAPAQ